MDGFKFGALFHKEWIAGQKDDEIEGYWAEDDTRYTITVPEQLRDMLLGMQNVLARKYRAVGALKHQAAGIGHMLRTALEEDEDPTCNCVRYKKMGVHAEGCVTRRGKV